MTFSSDGEMARPAIDEIGGGGSFVIFAHSATMFRPSKTGLPVRSSNVVHPSA